MVKAKAILLISAQRLAVAPAKWKLEFKEGRYPRLNVSTCNGVATPANKKRGEHENYDACQDHFFSER